jgi:hypothetical protein
MKRYPDICICFVVEEVPSASKVWALFALKQPTLLVFLFFIAKGPLDRFVIGSLLGSLLVAPTRTLG